MDKITDTYSKREDTKINKNNKKNRKKKIVIKDKKKFSIAICSILLVIFFIIFISKIPSKKKITADTDIYDLKIGKYSENIKEYYEQDGMEQKFVEDYNKIQNQAWMYIYNNISEDETMEKLINDVNSILKSDDWSKIGIEKNTLWRGTYIIDVDTNIVNFKFENSNIEPSWIINDNVSNFVIKN